MNRVLGVIAALLAALALAGCSQDARFRIEQPKAAPAVAAPPFVLIADTQYSVPGTDYELNYRIAGENLQITPALSVERARTFYRHSVANLALPEALDSILAAERRAGRRFGVLAGDLIEFACTDEAERMFAVLERHLDLPFAIALGNHDVMFHGSFDSDALLQAGAGPWDEYTMALWRDVCAANGGPFSKPDMIRRVLAYYEKAWGVPSARELGAGLALATDQTFEKVFYSASGWTLDLSVRLGPTDHPTAHRTSHLFQRFSAGPSSTLGGVALGRGVTLTLLDTTDYSTRAALCNDVGKLIELGMSGAISSEQIAWLDALPRAPAGHFVISHYLPFTEVEDEDRCELTAGSGCLWANRVARALGSRATFVYAHVHRPYQRQQLVDLEHDTRAPFDLVRLPSLIDNKTYVVFDGHQFGAVELAAEPGFTSFAPFHTTKETCRQRHRELVEFERNIACFRAGAVASACPPLEQAIVHGTGREDAICLDSGRKWKLDNAETWTKLGATPCGAQRPQQHFRCILRELAQRALEGAKLDAVARARFMRGQLGAVKTVAGR